MNFTYEATYEDCGLDVSVEVRLTYTVNWGCPARIHYDEHDHPAEPDELEITKVEVEDVESWLAEPRKLHWREATRGECDALQPWAKGLYGDMLVEAHEAEASTRHEH